MSCWNCFIGVTILLTTNASASTFEDPVAGFVTDLPDGYAGQSRQQAPGATILAFALVLESVEEVFGGPAEGLELNDFDIGGMPARWARTERGLIISHGIGPVTDDLSSETYGRKSKARPKSATSSHT